ncbi:hypothetical protein GQ44DRAFT_716133 [Phaeosphaeriaceae sp. PMI808]|nr:hypothetical protein GQ44DRAFT_716133 [Phaeosphaeriaceae sp. PMI808]
MSCPLLEQFRSAPFTRTTNILAIEMDLKSLQIIMNNVLDTHPNNVQQQLGETLYFRVGCKLAEQQEWNAMTFLQLEYEARVLGLLGPNEEHTYSEWDLRLKLATEARLIAKSD